MIRPAVTSDLSAVMAVFEKARTFMRERGNTSQWINGYPSESLITKDLENGNFYVNEEQGEITAAFSFIIGIEPTYLSIDGSWLDERPYGTIHRLASDGSVKRFADNCIAFCLKKMPNLRADTHKDNITMQKALQRNGFVYCGIIHVADGSERLAYQFSLK